MVVSAGNRVSESDIDALIREYQVDHSPQTAVERLSTKYSAYGGYQTPRPHGLGLRAGSARPAHSCPQCYTVQEALVGRYTPVSPVVHTAPLPALGLLQSIPEGLLGTWDSGLFVQSSL